MEMTREDYMRKILLLTSALLAITTSGSMSQDAANGEKVFKKCLACHTIESGASAKIGPNLFGVVGTTIATHSPDYAYSAGLKALGEAGQVWDDANLTAWLTKPSTFAKGNKMTYPGLKKPEEIADVIAYLKTKM
jgi:cytochrome c